jgi:hypothetical protein
VRPSLVGDEQGDRQRREQLRQRDVRAARVPGTGENVPEAAVSPRLREAQAGVPPSIGVTRASVRREATDEPGYDGHGYGPARHASDETEYPIRAVAIDLKRFVRAGREEAGVLPAGFERP